MAESVDLETNGYQGRIQEGNFFEVGGQTFIIKMFTNRKQNRQKR